MFGKIVAVSAGFVGGVSACLYAEAKIVKAIATPGLKQEVKEFGWAFAENIGYKIINEAKKPGRAPKQRRGRLINPVGYTNYSRGFAERNAMWPALKKDELTFGSVAVANEVLVTLRDFLNKYGSVTINDLADVIGSKMTRTFHNEKFGWTDLSEAVVLNETLILPDPIHLIKENC